MFVSMNNNEDCLYNALLIAHFKKDTENLAIDYSLQNGSKLTEKFETIEALNAKFDLVHGISLGVSEDTLKGFITSSTIATVVTLTQEEYDLISEKDQETLYVVTEDSQAVITPENN